MYKIIFYKGERLNYEINENGVVRNKETLKILQGNQKKNGYIEYCLYLKDKPIYLLGHRLVAETFIENPDPKNKLAINHMDGNKKIIA